MKNNHFAFAAALLVIPLLHACTRPPKPGLIPYDPQKAREHILPIEEAARYTESFRAAQQQLDSALLACKLKPDNFIRLTHAEKFNRDAIAVLLNQKGAEGIRIYSGRNPKGRLVLVMVPVDANGDDIIVDLMGKDSTNRDVAGIPGISSARAAVQPSGATSMERGQQCEPEPCRQSPLGKAQ